MAVFSAFSELDILSLIPADFPRPMYASEDSQTDQEDQQVNQKLQHPEGGLKTLRHV